MKLQDIALDKILVPEDRSRPVDEDYALAIQTEIVGGAFIDPILVRPTPRAKRPYTLIDGGHRLRAVELNDETEITCLVINASKAVADRMEVAANLFRHELTALDRAIAVQIYRRAWSETHGEIRRGNPQFSNCANFAQLDDCPIDTIAEEAARGFAASCAERLGLSRRAVEYAQRIALNLPGDLQRALRGTRWADNQAALLKLAELGEAQKKAIVEWIAAGKDPDAIIGEALGGTAAKVPAQTKVYNRLAGTWGRTASETRRRFVSENADDLAALLMTEEESARALVATWRNTIEDILAEGDGS
ncbi:MAG: ParB N-terminal domain-containing protein [Notoacmeibacter sp.]|nr:ParB N-terminal domain-containing protein [Notoacmeibacter sp.]